MKMKSGLIGEPTIFRSQTCDKYHEGGFFVAYSAMSGGIFVDMAIHDVDLSLWFFGEELTVPKTVSAHGVAALHPELLETNDRDNAVGIVQKSRRQNRVLLLLSHDGSWPRRLD